MLDLDLTDFIARHQLPNEYIAHAQNWFIPVAEQIVSHQIKAGHPIIVGINGAQGSGKSTLADLLVFLFNEHFELNSLTLSIDDFYLTRQQRTDLAETIHPLLLTRGVPGTHDLDLAVDTVDKLLQQNSDSDNTLIPRFNKAIDDREPPERWDSIHGQVDIIVIEGWCLGAESQSDEEIGQAINDLEVYEDPDAIWRNYVNQQLQNQYPKLFRQVDTWIMLQAPSFDCVFNWRLEQENKLRGTIDDLQETMDDKTVDRFIKHYQRITEHLFTTLPGKVDYLFELNEDRDIVRLIEQSHKDDVVAALKPLIFTDMDGSLLDHYSYSHKAADGLLASLERAHIPVIPATSKTKAELLFLRQSLKNTHPFIVENGAAVLIPIDYFPKQPDDTVLSGDFWVKEFVETRQHWQELLEQNASLFDNDYITFLQAGVEGIIEMTGLDSESALRASQRQYGEPVFWQGSDLQKQRFIDVLEQSDAHVLQGGRFLHVSGNCDKGLALKWLIAQYQKTLVNQEFIAIAIGDSQNDKAMLQQADIALIIRSPVHGLPDLQGKKPTFISDGMGPEGWTEGIIKILDAIKYTGLR